MSRSDDCCNVGQRTRLTEDVPWGCGMDKAQALQKAGLSGHELSAAVIAPGVGDHHAQRDESRAGSTTGRSAIRSGQLRWLAVEIAVVTAVVMLGGFLLHAPLALSVGVLLTCLVVNYYAGRQTVRPGLPHIGPADRRLLAACRRGPGFAALACRGLDLDLCCLGRWRDLRCRTPTLCWRGADGRGR